MKLLMILRIDTPRGCFSDRKSQPYKSMTNNTIVYV